MHCCWLTRGRTITRVSVWNPSRQNTSSELLQTAKTFSFSTLEVTQCQCVPLSKKKILVALKMHEQIRGSLQMLPITWKLIRTVWPWVWVDSTEAGTQSRPERKETTSDADNEAVSSGYCNQAALRARGGWTKRRRTRRTFKIDHKRADRKEDMGLLFFFKARFCDLQGFGEIRIPCYWFWSVALRGWCQGCGDSFKQIAY